MEDSISIASRTNSSSKAGSYVPQCVALVDTYVGEVAGYSIVAYLLA